MLRLLLILSCLSVRSPATVIPCVSLVFDAHLIGSCRIFDSGTATAAVWDNSRLVSRETFFCARGGNVSCDRLVGEGACQDGQGQRFDYCFSSTSTTSFTFRQCKRLAEETEFVIGMAYYDDNDGNTQCFLYFDDAVTSTETFFCPSGFNEKTTYAGTGTVETVSPVSFLEYYACE